MSSQVCPVGGLWSTESNAADRSSMMTAVASCFCIPHRMSSTSVTRLVSQLWFLLYADWYVGSNLFSSQCSANCVSVTFSTIFEINPRLLTGL